MELNLSCPHGMGERGMGLACGQVETHTQAHVILIMLLMLLLFLKPSLNLQTTFFKLGSSTNVLIKHKCPCNA